MFFFHILDKKLLLIYLSFILFIPQSFAENVRILGPRDNIDPAHHFFISLIKSLLVESLYDDVQLVSGLKLSQARIFKHIDNDIIDIVWSGTNIYREENYTPIRIPIFKGLLGHRFIIIHKDNLAKFEQISKPEQLKKLIACQGIHWPDSNILEANGYIVNRVVHYEAMFKMILKKRCDYFPRAIYEAFSERELLKKTNPELIVYDKIMLQYKLPVYFFVKKNNHALAEIIENNFIKYINNGEFTKSMNISNLLPKNINWDKVNIFALENLQLPPKTPINNKLLWFKVNN